MQILYTCVSCLTVEYQLTSVCFLRLFPVSLGRIWYGSHCLLCLSEENDGWNCFNLEHRAGEDFFSIVKLKSSCL